MLSLIETKISDLNDSNISIFVFGSSLTQRTPSDIDLLIIYKNGCINKCREVKQIVTERLSVLDLPIDWVTLSETEEREVAFVQKERAVKLVSKGEWNRCLVHF